MAKTAESSSDRVKLTQKQVEVLEHLVDHRSTKQIARILGISPSAVDQRIYGAADRLGETDRWELARKYAAIKLASIKPTGESSQVPGVRKACHSAGRDADAKGVFMFKDATSFEDFAPWDDEVRLPLLEKLDARTGPLGRVMVIVATAVLLALLFLATFVIARTLGPAI